MQQNTTLQHFFVCLFLQNLASLRGPSQVGVSSDCLRLAPPGCGLWLYESERTLGGGRWDQLNCSSILEIWKLVLALEAGNSRVYERHEEVETQNSGEGSYRGCGSGSSQYRQVLFEEPVVLSEPEFREKDLCVRESRQYSELLCSLWLSLPSVAAMDLSQI